MHPETLNSCDPIAPDLVRLHCLLIDLKDPWELLLVIMSATRTVVDKCLERGRDEETVDCFHVQTSERLTQLVLEELRMRTVSLMLELSLETRVLLQKFLDDYLRRNALHGVFLQKALLGADEELVSREIILFDQCFEDSACHSLASLSAGRGRGFNVVEPSVEHSQL